MKTKRTFFRTLAAFTFVASMTAVQAAPIGGRKVIVDQEKLQTMSVEDQEAVLRIQGRLEEILATDRSSLSSEERKELRTEFKGLKNEMEHYNAGGTVIYLSTAGIIIILLLLIILL